MVLRKGVPIAIIGLAVVLAWFARRAYYVGFFNDDAFYIIGAKSLLQGRYVELSRPGFPPLINYMPGFPALLAPVVWLFPKSLPAYQVFSIFLAGLGLCIFRSFLGRDVPASAAAASLAVVAFSPLNVSLSAQVLSDIPYLLFSLASFRFARRIWDSDDWRTWFVVAALSGFSYLIRPVGLAVGIAICLSLGFDRRWRTLLPYLLFLTAFIAPFAARQTLRYLDEMSFPYGQGLPGATVLGGAVANGAYYLKEIFIRNMFRWPWNSELLDAASIGTCLVFFGLGVWRFKPVGWRGALLLYLMFYAVVHLLWAKQSGRYVVPIFPFVVYFFFIGVDRAVHGLKYGGAVIGGIAALVLLCYAGPLFTILKASVSLQTPLNHPPIKTYQWIRSHTEPADIFAAELDGRFFLHTDRQVFHLPKIYDRNEFLSWCLERKVSYVLLDPAPFVMSTPRGGTPHDLYPPRKLEAFLSDERSYKKAFNDHQEGLALYRVIKVKPTLDREDLRT